jgi:hypothetical protein
MDWNELCENPILQNLPFKIELNEWGQILMSPASNRHGKWRSRVGGRLSSLAKNGELITNCSVQTSKGVRVADVAWVSAKFFATYGHTTPSPMAPELCVELKALPDAAERQKANLYFEAGAKEVWLCDDGAMTFISPEGQ